MWSKRVITFCALLGVSSLPSFQGLGFALDCENLSKTYTEASPQENLGLLTQDAIGWLEQIPAAQPTLSRFLERRKRGLLSVQVLIPGSLTGVGVPAGVVAVFAPESILKLIEYNSMAGVLSLNPIHELGFFIPSFFHEMVHSVDDDYFQALKERRGHLKKALQAGASSEEAQLAEEIGAGAGFVSERKAYDEQVQLTIGLIDEMPCAQDYYQGLSDKGTANFLATAKSLKIIKSYGFDEGLVTAYLGRKGKLDDLKR
jgi:hypothetical protein